MAINFTDSPADGATQVVGGRTYTYNSAKNKWDTTATEVTGPTATVYATVDALPTSGNITGAQAYVSGNNRLYIWNGTGWYNIALINTAPTISGVNAAYELATDGSSTSVVITATDPEGLPLTYSIVSDTSGDIATVTQGVGGNTDIFTITPTTNTENGGTFSLTFRASDGVNIATAVSEFTLVFKVTNSNYTTALITTSGSAGTNSTFTDSSSNSHAVTAYGNTTQTSFSPHRHGGYSTYFDGTTGTKLTTSSSFDFSGAYTVEYWVNTTDGMSVNTINNTFGDMLYLQVYVNTSTGTANHRSRTSNSVYNTVTGTTDLRDGQWHHIAAVRNSSGIMTLYVDGVSEGTSVTDSTNLGTNQQITLGAFDYENTAFDGWRTGYVRDFRVSSNARYSSNFTAPTEPLTADSNTTLLTCHLPYFADGSTNDYTITRNGNVSTQPVGPYDYKEYTVGEHGGSAYFDGSGDYLRADTALDAFTSTSDPWTMEAWVYPPRDPGTVGGTINDLVFGCNTASAGGNVFNLATGILYIGQDINLNTKAVPNTWNHMAAVYDGSTFKVYMNGKLSNTHTWTPSTALSNLVFGIGTEFDSANGGSPGNYYQGNISDVRVSDSAIYTTDFTPPTSPLTSSSGTQALIHMQGAKILDKSQSTESLALAGNTTASTAQYKYLPTSMYFDGTGDYISMPTDTFAFGTDDFTIEFWIYHTSATGYQTPFDLGYIDAGSILMQTANNSLAYVTYHGSTLQLQESGSFSTNTWYHIALVRNGATMTLYRDGTASATGTYSNNYNYSGAKLSNIGAGHWNSPGTNPITGYISDFRVTKGLARYTANFTPPSAALDG